MSAPLPHAHGSPPLRASLRAGPGDFQVTERLGFEPAGSGEHAFVQIEKTGANTEWVARELAAAARVPVSAIGFAGLKDRHAVTRQAFTVHLPGRPDPDWNALAITGVKVLSATRHDCKLRRGAHRGNGFVIRLREVEGDRDHAGARLAAIGERGVPNYFGEQRFGRDAHNLELAQALFEGRRLPRAQRGFALSAARADLFNALLALRVQAGNWDRALEGEVWMLDRTHSIFGPEPWNEALAQRLGTLDIHPTGPLWGRGELRSAADVRALEAGVAAMRPQFAHGLEAAGLEQERRALRLRAEGLTCAWEDPRTLVLSFELGAGAFATTVLRELCDWNSAADPG
jgi:tRNA pseudouridine13 synthase